MLHHSLNLISYKNLFNQFIDLDRDNNLPSRILLVGQDGIGKSTFALHLINYLLSKKEITKYNVDDNTINTSSPSYNHVKNLSHPNFFYITKIDGKKNIEVDQIRNLINFINKSSFDNNKKIILLDGTEHLNASSSNALLKSLEESNEQNIFILTHNINIKLFDTIKSRCLVYRLNFNYSKIKNVINNHFGNNVYEELSEDFKSIVISPKFLINHINFINDSNFDLMSADIESIIRYIIEKKIYKKGEFISNNFQTYVEIYFVKMYSKTKDKKYYESLLKLVSEKNIINKFNLDLESFFTTFENKYLNI
tara:strand:- start:4871 stop:5797 length:927 start_codon:yes stop_codon:yes gene_type:complete